MSVVSQNAVFSGDYCWERFPHVKYDVLVMPTTITPADPLPNPDDSAIIKMSKTIGKLDNTCPFNATGHPALAMPIGFVPAKDDPKVKVPASLQIVGKHFDEVTVLQAAFAWENARDWKKFSV